MAKVDGPVLPFLPSDSQVMSGDHWVSMASRKDPKAEPSQFLPGPSSFPVTLCAQQVFIEVDRNVSRAFAGLGPGASRQATAS